MKKKVIITLASLAAVGAVGAAVAGYLHYTSSRAFTYCYFR